MLYRVFVTNKLNRKSETCGLLQHVLTLLYLQSLQWLYYVSTFFGLHVSLTVYFLSSHFLQFNLFCFSSLFFLSRFVPYLISFLAHHISFQLVSSRLVSGFIWSRLILSFFTFQIICFSSLLVSFILVLSHVFFVLQSLSLVLCSILILSFLPHAFHLFSFHFFHLVLVFLVSSNQVSYFLLSNLVSCLVSYGCILSLFSFQII